MSIDLMKVKSYVLAAGLAGLALYQLTQGDLVSAAASVGAAATMVGLRLQLPVPPPKDPPDEPPHFPRLLAA
jgi:hypothetical protein